MSVVLLMIAAQNHAGCEVLHMSTAELDLAHVPPPQDVTSVDGLFDQYINTCADQGSRTIRTEEAVLISMAYLSNAISCAHGEM